jgi:uncharacterized membrane protein
MQSDVPLRGSVQTPSVRKSETVSTRLVIAVDRGIYRFARHWLRWTNLLFWIYVCAIIAAPLLTVSGQSRMASPLYRFFGLFCHQQDDRSFHIAGHPFACCERCAAVYCSMAVAATLFTLFRGRTRRIRYAELVALCTPLVIDGMAVGAGLYPGNALVRVMTGALFGLALVWAAFPRLDAGFATMRARLIAMFDRLAAQGRAKPLSA